MELKAVNKQDRAFVLSLDPSIGDKRYEGYVYTKSAYVLWENEQRVGLLTHCVLWDTLPFMNLLYVQAEYRRQGFGKQAIVEWEREMKKMGYSMVLVSTRVDEQAQHLYRQLGYVDCGGLLFENTPLDQPMELFLRKVL